MDDANRTCAGDMVSLSHPVDRDFPRTRFERFGGCHRRPPAAGLPDVEVNGLTALAAMPARTTSFKSDPRKSNDRSRESCGRKVSG